MAAADRHRPLLPDDDAAFMRDVETAWRAARASADHWEKRQRHLLFNAVRDARRRPCSCTSLTCGSCQDKAMEAERTYAKEKKAAKAARQAAAADPENDALEAAAAASEEAARAAKEALRKPGGRGCGGLSVGWEGDCKDRRGPPLNCKLVGGKAVPQFTGRSMPHTSSSTSVFLSGDQMLMDYRQLTREDIQARRVSFMEAYRVLWTPEEDKVLCAAVEEHPTDLHAISLAVNQWNGEVGGPEKMKTDYLFGGAWRYRGKLACRQRYRQITNSPDFLDKWAAGWHPMGWCGDERCEVTDDGEGYCCGVQQAGVEGGGELSENEDGGGDGFYERGDYHGGDVSDMRQTAFTAACHPRCGLRTPCRTAGVCQGAWLWNHTKRLADLTLAERNMCLRKCPCEEGRGDGGDFPTFAEALAAVERDDHGVMMVALAAADRRGEGGAGGEEKGSVIEDSGCLEMHGSSKCYQCVNAVHRCIGCNGSPCVSLKKDERTRLYNNNASLQHVVSAESNGTRCYNCTIGTRLAEQAALYGYLGVDDVGPPDEADIDGTDVEDSSQDEMEQAEQGEQEQQGESAMDERKGGKDRMGGRGGHGDGGGWGGEYECVHCRGTGGGSLHNTFAACNEHEKICALNPDAVVTAVSPSVSPSTCPHCGINYHLNSRLAAHLLTFPDGTCPKGPGWVERLGHSYRDTAARSGTGPPRLNCYGKAERQ